MTDVLVVGGGHNGLTAACYLARAGLDVLVVEAGSRLGGCTSSGPYIEGAPEHTVSPCAGDIITMRTSTVVEDLQLRRFGFGDHEVDPAYCAVDLDGASLAFWRDPRRTAEEIRRFSPRDATAFLALMTDLDAALDVMMPMIAQNPLRPQPRALGRAAGAAVRHPRRLAAVASLAGRSAADAIAARFEHPIVRAGIGVQANFGAPITGAGTAVNLAVLALLARVGMSRPDGGMQAVPDALAACLAHHGGRTRTGSPVDEILIDGGRAVGVRLESGEELRAPRVLAATDPATALNRLLPAGALSPRHAARARRIPTGNDGCAHFKVDLALDSHVRLPRHTAQRRDDLDLRTPSLMIGSFDELCAAIGDAQHGRIAQPMPMVAILPTGLDPAGAPAGEETAYLWAGFAPHAPEGGWEAATGPTGDQIVAHAAQYFDGLEAQIIARRYESSPQIARRTRATDGNVYHVDLNLLRTGPLRPALGFGGYRTPLDGLYLTGAGSHPGPSVSGIPGQLAAREILRDAGPVTARPVAEPPAPALHDAYV
jgi:phytoene dehydrogenase-like protein